FAVMLPPTLMVTVRAPTLIVFAPAVKLPALRNVRLTGIVQLFARVMPPPCRMLPNVNPPAVMLLRVVMLKLPEGPVPSTNTGIAAFGPICTVLPPALTEPARLSPVPEIIWTLPPSEVIVVPAALLTLLEAPPALSTTPNLLGPCTIGLPFAVMLAFTLILPAVAPTVVN